jgi:hypothetical protein
VRIPTATTGVPPQGGSGGTTAPAESQPGGAGDEEAIRVPAHYAIDGRTVTPRRVNVPAFLPIEVRLTSRDGRPHDVRIDAPGGGLVQLAAGGTAVRRLPGARAGSFPIVVDGAVRAELRVGLEPGP